VGSPVGSHTPVGVTTPTGAALNLGTLGWSLYGTERVTAVLLVGATLFVAMVAAICLSLVGGENYRTQEYYSQIRKSNAVFVLRASTLVVATPLEWFALEDSTKLLLTGLGLFAVGCAGVAFFGPPGPDEPDEPFWRRVIRWMSFAVLVLGLGIASAYWWVDTVSFQEETRAALGTVREYLYLPNYTRVFDSVVTDEFVEETARKVLERDPHLPVEVARACVRSFYEDETNRILMWTEATENILWRDRTPAQNTEYVTRQIAEAFLRQFE